VLVYKTSIYFFPELRWNRLPFSELAWNISVFWIGFFVTLCSFHFGDTVEFSVLCVPSAITLENPKIRPNFRKKPEKGLKTSGLILE